MKILHKVSDQSLTGFKWVNNDSLPDSEGFKFEIYYDTGQNIVDSSIQAFYLLFENFIDSATVRPLGDWGGFCLDTWDMENEQYDFSPKNKTEPTASYLSMLLESQIEPQYEGFCKCIDWDSFLRITLHCVMTHVAPYSFRFYIKNGDFVFYFHHTGSFGIYYSKFNEAIQDILSVAQRNNLVVDYITDGRVQEFLR